MQLIVSYHMRGEEEVVQEVEYSGKSALETKISDLLHDYLIPTTSPLPPIPGLILDAGRFYSYVPHIGWCGCSPEVWTPEEWKQETERRVQWNSRSRLGLTLD